MSENQETNLIPQPESPRGRPVVRFDGGMNTDPPADESTDDWLLDDSSESTDVNNAVAVDDAPIEPSTLTVDEPIVVDDDPIGQILVDDSSSLGIQLESLGPPTLAIALADVNAWAERWKVSDDPYVAEVRRVIVTRDDPTVIASLSPFDLLPTPRRELGGTLMRLARLMLFVRNISVFAPVALTWLAINAATEGFGDYLDELREQSAESVTQASFLDFWQDGYGRLDHFWRIQSVAFLAALIIVGIIAMTFLAGLLQAAAMRVGSAKEEELERERTEVALKLSRALHGNRTATPESISEALSVVLNDLTQATKGVLMAAQRMERASIGINSLSPHLQAFNQQVMKFSSDLSGSVVPSVTSLVQSVGHLGTSISGDMRTLLLDVMTGLEEVNDRLNRTSVGVEFGTKQLRDDLEAIHQRLMALTNPRR